ncbi:hypothetical protein V8D89_006972, partial [Ganoderma adspersum]
MVRSQGKQTPDDRKESKKKSSTAAANSVKKKPDTGSWPCKMDGCKKVFAREADLKRHQRTTKTHSIPGLYWLPISPLYAVTTCQTDALRRHQKSRHNGVVIEPIEQEKDKDSGEGASSGSRSPSPAESPARSLAEGSVKGSPSAGPSSSAGGSSSRTSSYYRPHTMQDGYYPGYPPRPPPGVMMDPHYPPPPMGLPTSATRGSWQPAAVPPPWPGPDGQPLPPPGMYIPASYYPSPYYRHPGMPPHLPQINPELLAQSNGNGIGPPESSLRNTSADSPKADRSASASPSVGRREDTSKAESHEDEGPDASTLMAAAALQAVLAYQKEQEAREAEARAASASTGTASTPLQSDERLSPAHAPSQTVRVERPPDVGPSVVPTSQIDPDLDAAGEPDGEDVPDGEEQAERGKSAEEFVSEGGTPMLNPGELDASRATTVELTAMLVAELLTE